MDDAQLALIPELPPEGRLTTLPIASLKWGIGQSPDKAFVESIKRFGILQPILAADSFGAWRVLDGRRRVLAAQACGLEHVPAFVLPDGAVNPHVVQLVSHALRSRNRAAEIDAIEELFKEGAGEREIAEATGLTVGEVRAILPLMDLTPTFRTALRDGKIAATVAADIVKLPSQAQRRLEDAYVERGKVTANDVKEQRQARTQHAVAALALDSLALDVPDTTEDDLVEQPVVGVPKGTGPQVPWDSVISLVQLLESAQSIRELREEKKRICMQLREWRQKGATIA